MSSRWSNDGELEVIEDFVCECLCDWYALLPDYSL